MAVVIDEDFFEALAPMEAIDDISSADIAWFIVAYEADGAAYRLARKRVHFTTLERAVEGLTAGRPVTLSVFESRILTKLKKVKVK